MNVVIFSPIKNKFKILIKCGRCDLGVLSCAKIINPLDHGNTFIFAGITFFYTQVFDPDYRRGENLPSFHFGIFLINFHWDLYGIFVKIFDSIKN